MFRNASAALAVAVLLGACSNSGHEGAGLQLVQFLGSERDKLARNRALTSTLSAAVQEGEDFAERLTDRASSLESNLDTLISEVSSHGAFGGATAVEAALWDQRGRAVRVQING